MFARKEGNNGIFATGTQSVQHIEEGKWTIMEQEITEPLTRNVDRVDILFLMTQDSKGTVYWDKLELFTEE